MTSPSDHGACPPQLGVSMANNLTNNMNLTVLTASDFGMAEAVPPLNYDLNSSSCGDSSSESRSPEIAHPKASDRESRIIAEKQRRSQFNAEIARIMALLANVMHSQRKIDKTGVLRIAADILRGEHVFGNAMSCYHLETWSLSFLKFFDLFGGFMLGITCRGRIFCVSPNIQEKLGYSNIDLISRDFYDFVHPEDKELLRQHIYPSELSQPGFSNKIFEQHHNFNIRILRAGARSEPPRYECCNINGQLRKSDRATADSVQDELKIKRARVRQVRTFPSSGNDFVFIGMVHLLTSTLPAHRMLPPTAYSEYWTRHLIDGRIVQCDQSISLVAGYMTDEVTGTSAFVFMHKEDVRWVICVLRQMYDQSKEFGESYYRLMSRSGHFIYMRSRGFLEIDKNTKQVQSFVCVNSVISEDFGKRMMQDMKRKYSVLVDVEMPQKVESVVVDEVPVENPRRLERIVMHLVEPSVNETGEQLKLVPPPVENIITAIANSEKVVQETGVRFDTRKRKIDNSNCDSQSDYIKRPSGLVGTNFDL